MKNSTMNRSAASVVFGACLLAASTGWSAPKQVELWAKPVSLTMPDGVTVPMWGFADSADGAATVPGPQINVTSAEFADGLQIIVHNELSEPVSVVIPGLVGGTAGQPVRFTSGDYANRVRSFAQEAAVTSGTATYSWTSLRPGTFIYFSGSHPALQVQMGLFGMVVIKSNDAEAYPGVPIGDGGEVPVVLSDIDPVLHDAVAAGKYGPLPLEDAQGNPTGNISSTLHSQTSYHLINGVAYSDNTTPELSPSGKTGVPTLFRIVNAGWDAHVPVISGPFPSGSENYVKAIAEDGSPYPFPKTLNAPYVPAMKTMDVVFTPPVSADPVAYQIYDRRSTANANQPGGGMFRTWTAGNASATAGLVLDRDSVTFSARTGLPFSADQVVNVFNSGQAPLNWTTLVDSGSVSWLSATPGGTGNGTINLHVNVAGLAPGLHTGTVTVSADGASGSPHDISVSLNLLPPYVSIASIDTKNTTGNNTTHVLTGVAPGSLLVITTGAEIGNQNAAISNNRGLNFVKSADARESGSGARSNAEIWTAAFPAGGDISITCRWNGSSSVPQSSVCYVVANAETTLLGAAETATNQSAPSISIQTTRAHSILICVSLDRNAQNGGSRTYRDGATEAFYFRSTGSNSSSAFHYYKLAPAVGSYTEGLTAPTGQDAASAVLEIRSQP